MEINLKEICLCGLIENFITLYPNGVNDAGHTGILNPLSPIFDQEPAGGDDTQAVVVKIFEAICALGNERRFPMKFRTQERKQRDQLQLLKLGMPNDRKNLIRMNLMHPHLRHVRRL